MGMTTTGCFTSQRIWPKRLRSDNPTLHLDDKKKEITALIVRLPKIMMDSEVRQDYDHRSKSERMGGAYYRQ
jgi:hypothetical protein